MADTSFVSSAENAVLKTVRINALDANRNRRSVEPSDGLTCAVIIKRGNWADGHVDDLNSVSFEDSEIRCISPVEDLTEYISDLTSKQQVQKFYCSDYNLNFGAKYQYKKIYLKISVWNHRKFCKMLNHQLRQNRSNKIMKF